MLHHHRLEFEVDSRPNTIHLELDNSLMQMDTDSHLDRYHNRDNARRTLMNPDYNPLYSLYRSHKYLLNVVYLSYVIWLVLHVKYGFWIFDQT